MIEDLLLAIAAFGFTFSAIPQIFLMYKTKNSQNVSLMRSTIIFLCVTLTIIASIMLHLWITVLINAIQLVFVLCMIVEIITYR